VHETSCTAGSGDEFEELSVFDAGRCQERNTVERCVNKLTAFRAVATRCNKRERIYQGTRRCLDPDLAP
jgi:transposase